MSRRLHRAELSRLLDPHTSMDAEGPRRHGPLTRTARSSKAPAPAAPHLSHQVHLQGDLPVVQALPGGGRVKAWTHAIEANRALGRRLAVTGTAIHCHHNYVAAEQHWGETVWVTRKGAIRAGVGEWGLIPGSMGAESFVVRGKGNAASYQSCAHGAGRAMSRTEARATFTTKGLRRQTAGVECRKDAGVVDEAPGAYKPIREVMAHQRDLVDIVHTLRQVVCIKG